MKAAEFRIVQILKKNLPIFFLEGFEQSIFFLRKDFS